MEKRGWRNEAPVCLRSVGTSCISRFLGTIKLNELFHFVVALVKHALTKYIFQKS